MSNLPQWNVAMKSDGAIVIRNRKKTEIAAVFDVRHASLIAAAPQMLDVLRMFMNNISMSTSNPWYEDALRAADAAIIAATREAK